MALLEWGSRRLTLPVGESVAGTDPTCAVRVTGDRVLPRHAVLVGQADGQVVIRKAVPEADIVINGVRLGAEPTPLLHGDKLELAGVELTFVDERRSGSTQYIQAMQFPEAAAQARAEARAGSPTASTGGRVVSLTDGREYIITGTSLVFGREAGCDVVVPNKDVSRRHAEIMVSPKGYLLVDSSTNGTFVNGEQVQGQRLLMRADVIGVGDETFRFYADAAPAPGTPPPPPPATPPEGATQRLQDTAFGLPTVKRGEPTATPALASFLVRAGALRGHRLPVRTPVVNIGRADYNDLVLPDESVSTAHAKLQRREGVWVLSDLESTNGTFVDGERVEGEMPLAPSAVVRFGEVSLVFEPLDDALGVEKGGGTRTIQAMPPQAAAPPPRPAPPPAVPSPAPARPPAAPAPRSAPLAPPAAPPPAARPHPRRPAAGQPPQPAKGKGCGASAILVLLGAGAAITLMLG